MFDVSTIGAAVTGLKTAASMLSGLVSVRDARMIQAEIAKLTPIIIDAHQSVLTAQKEQMALLEEIAALKRRAAELEGKGDERERYKLTDMGGGSFAYSLRDAKDGEPTPPVCAKCFESGHISTLQKRGTMRGQTAMRCPSCKSPFYFGEPEPPPEPSPPNWSQFTGARRRGFGRR